MEMGFRELKCCSGKSCKNFSWTKMKDEHFTGNNKTDKVKETAVNGTHCKRG